jgi:hypothetical protein
MPEVEGEPLRMGGVAMEGGLQRSAKERVEEGRGAEVEGRGTIGKLLTQTAAEHVSKLSILEKQKPLDGSEMGLDGTSGEEMIQQRLIHKI